MSYDILSKIKSPDDVKMLSDEQLKQLCEEIREKLVDVTSVNGGHLSPNLGVVELTVMLHKVFSCPKDSIVFDVGHQSYTHKMLTGRYRDIDTIRTEGGLSGFPKRSESKYDAFNTGHSSTSISAAYGIAKAKQLTGDDSFTIAVIGDGSLTGGEAYEGMNNVSMHLKKFIIILNDNKMSISKNVGAMARHLTSIRTQPWYIRFKSLVERSLTHVPFLGRHISNGIRKSKSKLKQAILKNTIFEQMGFTYYGPVDGHDIEALENAFNAAKRSKHPSFIHVITVKGKGYEPAENDSASFHGIGKFDIESGEPLSKGKSFSSYFGEKLCMMAQTDSRICAITAAMRTGTGLVDFSRLYKDRFFDVGIAEQHAVTFAGGLATKGMIPVFAVYSTFIQRAYDQLIHDIAMQKLHVVIAVDRAGVVGEDGETHQGLFDVALFNTIPNATVFSPSYFDDLGNALETAVNSCNDLVCVRYMRGGEGYRPEGLTLSSNYSIYGDEDADTLVVTYGRLFSNAAKACDELKDEGINICILKLCKIKPVDSNCVKLAMKYIRVIFFEEGILSGGIAETFEELLNREGYEGKYCACAVDDKFVQHAAVDKTLEKLGLDVQGMIKTIKGNR